LPGSALKEKQQVFAITLFKSWQQKKIATGKCTLCLTHLTNTVSVEFYLQEKDREKKIKKV